MGSIIIVIIFIVISAMASSAKKSAANNQRNSRPVTPPQRRQDIPGGNAGNRHDEYYGEGLPPSKDVCDPRGSHGSHTPHAKVSVPEPRQRTREAPKATVNTTLKSAAETVEDDTPATIEIAGTDMSFSGDNAIKAVLYAEILGKPRALR